MKPVITAVLSDRGSVVGSTLPQTLFVKGTGLAAPLILVFEGPMPVQVLRAPQVQLTDDGAIAVVDVPVPAQGSPSVNPGKVWAVSGGLVSDEFDFEVGRSS